MHYQDFVIEASSIQADGRFRIEVPRSPAGGLDEEIVSVYEASLVDPLVEQLKDSDRRLAMSLDEVIALGSALAAMLFPGKVEQILRESLGLVNAHREGLRLRLELRDPRLASLPWEYVYWQRVGDDPSLSGFLVRNPHFSIVRYTRMLRPGPRLDAPVSRLKVFAVFAEPEGMGELDQHTVSRDLKEAFKDEEGITLQVEESLTRQELQDTMLRETYDIFGFSGHGGFLTWEDVAAFEQSLQPEGKTKDDSASAQQVEQAAQRATAQDDFLSHMAAVNAQVRHTDEKNTEPAKEQEAAPPEAAVTPDDFLSHMAAVNTQVGRAQAGVGASAASQENREPEATAKHERRQGLLVLEDAQGKRDYVPGDELAPHLHTGGVRVVVLDGCELAMRDTEHFWNGLAPALVREGIPAVVAMQYGFKDTAAIAFWRAFYRSLAAGKSLEEAVAQGRIAIMGLPFDRDDDTGDPFTCKWDFAFPVLYMQAETREGIVFPRTPAGGDDATPVQDLVSPTVITALAHLDKPEVQTAYGGFLGVLAQQQPGLVKDLEKLESKPDSSARQKVFTKKVAEAGANADAEVAAAIQALAAALEAETGEKPSGIRVEQTVIGDKNIVAGTGNINLGDVDFGG